MPVSQSILALGTALSWMMNMLVFTWLAGSPKSATRYLPLTADTKAILDVLAGEWTETSGIHPAFASYASLLFTKCQDIGCSWTR